MFDIEFNDQGVVVSGRLDAAQAEVAQQFMDRMQGQCVIDMTELEYISSAGLGVLLKTQAFDGASGGLQLVNVNSHINDVFRYSGFDKLFIIRTL